MSPDLFVSDAVQERTITLGDGSAHTLHFRELSAAAFRAFQIAEQSEDEDTRASSMARLIASSVCEPDGKPAMTRERAAQLKPAVMNSIVTEILALNRLGDKAKNS